jgi:hypothetical protein
VRLVLDSVNSFEKLPQKLSPGDTELRATFVEIGHLFTFAAEDPFPGLCVDRVGSGTVSRTWPDALELHKNVL